MKKAHRYFYVYDVDSVIIVDLMTRKELLACLDEYLEAVEMVDSKAENARFICLDDESFDILYDDGTEDYIDSSYDGHHIRRQHIASIVYSNPCSYGVFGCFNMNKYGCAYATFEDEISPELLEVDSEDYTAAASAPAAAPAAPAPVPAAVQSDDVQSDDVQSDDVPAPAPAPASAFACIWVRLCLKDVLNFIRRGFLSEVKEEMDYLRGALHVYYEFTCPRNPGRKANELYFKIHSYVNKKCIEIYGKSYLSV